MDERGVTLSLDATGIVKKISFTSGEEVRSGQKLLELHSGDELEQLAALRANAALSHLTYQRDKAQFAFHAVSKAALQSAKYTWINANALAKEEKHLIEKKILRAPFSGKIGIRLVNVGEYLTPGTAVAELQSLDKILVDFMLPQRDVNQLKLGQIIRAHIDAFPQKTFLGRITAINPLVDSTSRNVQVRALLKPSHYLLLPGMFATIEIRSGPPAHYVTLPQTAISYNSYGDTIYFIQKSKHGLIARQKFVVLGPKHRDQVAILSGIAPGEVIVTSGQIKLHNGAIVLVNNQTPWSTKFIKAQVRN
jgi:membrane fusion protein (multidrug efflux system)